MTSVVHASVLGDLEESRTSFLHDERAGREERNSTLNPTSEMLHPYACSGPHTLSNRHRVAPVTTWDCTSRVSTKTTCSFEHACWRLVKGTQHEIPAARQVQEGSRFLNPTSAMSHPKCVFSPTHTLPNPCAGKVFAVEMHHKSVDQACPSDNVGSKVKSFDKRAC